MEEARSLLMSAYILAFPPGNRYPYTWTTMAGQDPEIVTWIQIFTNVHLYVWQNLVGMRI